MIDIQAARAVLERWGKDTTPGPWARRGSGSVVTERNGVRGLVAFTGIAPRNSADAALIVAMTHPDLRAALDGMLELAGDGGVVPATFSFYARSIAAAILKIDKEMTA